MRVLLAPPGAEDPRRLPHDPGGLVSENLVVGTGTSDALKADVGTQVDGVADTAVGPAQRDLERHVAVGEQDARQAGARVREGQFGGPRHDFLDPADGPAQLIRHLHRVGLGAQFRGQHVA